MILDEIELSELKRNLLVLKSTYQIKDEDKYKDDIIFIRNMITKIENELTNCNKVIYKKLGQAGYIDKIYTGGELYYYKDKFNGTVGNPLLKNHIGESFEYHIVNLSSGETTVENKILKDVMLDSEGEIKNIIFS